MDRIAKESFKMSKALSKPMKRDSINHTTDNVVDNKSIISTTENAASVDKNQLITFCDSTISKIIRECWS